MQDRPASSGAVRFERCSFGRASPGAEGLQPRLPRRCRVLQRVTLPETAAVCTMFLSRDRRPTCGTQASAAGVGRDALGRSAVRASAYAARFEIGDGPREGEWRRRYCSDVPRPLRRATIVRLTAPRARVERDPAPRANSRRAHRTVAAIARAEREARTGRQTPAALVPEAHARGEDKRVRQARDGAPHRPYPPATAGWATVLRRPARRTIAYTAATPTRP